MVNFNNVSIIPSFTDSLNESDPERYLSHEQRRENYQLRRLDSAAGAALAHFGQAPLNTTDVLAFMTRAINNLSHEI